MKRSQMNKVFWGVLVIGLMTWTRVSLFAAPQAEMQIDIQPAALIDINRADAAQLESIKGIGPALAERIINFREERGGFKTLEELREVKGIGAVKYEKIKEQVTLS